MIKAGAYTVCEGGPAEAKQLVNRQLRCQTRSGDFSWPIRDRFRWGKLQSRTYVIKLFEDIERNAFSEMGMLGAPGAAAWKRKHAFEACGIGP